MTTFERRQRILELIREHSQVEVVELARLLDVSQGTIRNDLRGLEEENQLVRVRGGAVLNDNALHCNPTFSARAQINKEAKRRIARWAADVVADNDSILLDASTTVSHMVPFLQDIRDLTIITNGIETALALARNPSHTVILVGGVLRSDGISVSGHLSERILEDLHVKTAFVSCSGFSVDSGLTEVHIEQARLKSKMIRCAERVVALVDSQKFGRVDLTSFAGLDKISHVFTDSDTDPELVEQLRRVCPSLTVCGENTVVSFLPDGQEKPHYRIGFANMSENMPFAVDVRRGLERAAQEAGNVDLVVADNQLSSQVALEIADRLIAKEVDLVIEFHIDQKIGSLLADKYKQAGIPVLAIDIPIIGGTFVGVNNHQVGHVAGVALGNWIKANWQGEYDRVIALEEPRASSVPAARILGQLIGFGEVLGEIPDSKIVHVDSGNTTATCQPEVAGVLQQLPDLHRLAVISFNDDSALGALYAAREAGREEDVIIVGQGADRIGREEIRRPNSRLIGSTAFQPEAYGKTLIAIAADILEGKPVPPAVYVKHTFIDSTNIDELYPE